MKKHTDYNFFKFIKITIFGFFIIALLGAIFLLFQLHKFTVLKNGRIVNIPNGYSIIKTSELLSKNDIINSSSILRYYMQFNDLSPKSGPYYFEDSINILGVAKKISEADYGNVYQKVMIPEGVTNKQLISVIKKSRLTIDTTNLINLIDGKEGYLFPDTYSFLPNASEEDVVMKMEATFSENIEKIEKDKTINKMRNEIVIMASLIEKEASRDLNEKQIISGILWKRISVGMPLQVDAPFLYEIGKSSAQLSMGDLKKDSPYNTYIHTGLTPTPIGNPGYDALYASAHPIDSEYYFYLHGKDGKVHYAKTYSGHLKNKRNYLN